LIDGAWPHRAFNSQTSPTLEKPLNKDLGKRQSRSNANTMSKNLVNISRSLIALVSQFTNARPVSASWPLMNPNRTMFLSTDGAL
jgi:hypothetical protein